MNVLFYGIGRFFQRRREKLYKLSQDDIILGFIDKRATVYRKVDGFPVYTPEEAARIDFDAIVITSTFLEEMSNVLFMLHIPSSKVLSYDAYIAIKQVGVQYEFGSWGNSQGKKLLMISEKLDYFGGALALLHAAVAMAEQGHRVTVVAPEANENILREFTGKSIKICVIPSIRYLKTSDILWMRKYDVCLVNVFLNGAIAIQASSVLPVLWWMHEPSNRFSSFYHDIRKEFPEVCNADNFSRLRIAAVSEQAKANFEHYYPGRVDAIMPYCLPDSGQDGIDEPQERVTFAIIGGVCRLKGQDVFLRAVALLPKQVKEKAAFVLIGGSDGKDAFSAAVRAEAEKEPSVKFLGVLNRAEMRKAYRQIDVVVCASREECLPTTMAEGMMYRKICIATDAAGMNGMIQSGKNGWIVPVEDAEALASRMRHIIERPREYEAMRCAARHTYEAYFTPEKFSERLIEELGKTVECWGKKV